LPKKKEKTTISVEVANDILKTEQPFTVVPNANKEYTVFSTTHVKDDNELDFEQASYNFGTNQHLIDKIVQIESSAYPTSIEEINNLSQNTQNDVDKIIRINKLIRYYANKNDLVGIVIGTIENNVNTNYKITYPKLPDNIKKKNKLKDKVDTLLSNFFDNIDLKAQIRKEGMSTFSQGTYFTYLRENKDGTYGITTYPLNLVKFTDYTIDGEPVLYMDMLQLQGTLQQSLSKYSQVKSSFINFSTSVEEEIQRNYPPEVYEAYVNKYRYAILNPQRTGVHRINQLDGVYGVSPIFKAFSSLLMLETIENIDRENILATSKKIFYQRTRKELMGQNFEKTKNFAELKYAQEELVRAMGQKVVIYTSPAYVEGLEIIEPKAELTEQTVILRYKNQILNSFGISFLSNESKSSFNSVQVSVDELLKTVNKIIEQFENTINKYIRLVCIDNGIDPNFIPVVNIEKSELLDNEAKLKLVELIYSKLGFSYKTVCEILEMDYNTEVERRKEENDNGLDDVFYPHITSYTAKDSETSDVAIDKGDLTPTEVNTNSNGSQKNENLDQNAENKARKDGQL
jgi:hypothetical protein